MTTENESEKAQEHTNDMSDSEQVLEQCRQEKKKYLNEWKRAKADLINYKQAETERTNQARLSLRKNLLEKLIVVLDSFDMSLAETAKDVDREGMETINMQLLNILAQEGLERIEVSRGDMFSPEEHEAIAQVESDEKEDTILEIVAKGYRFGDKILRPARVKVAKSKPQDN